MSNLIDYGPFDVLKDGVSSVQLIQHVGSDKMMVNAARVSYLNDLGGEFTDRDGGLIRYMIEHKHGSVFEHSLITFRIKAPLYVIQEMLRHRHLSFNQESARYVEPSKNEIEVERKFYVPNDFRLQSKTNKQSSGGSLYSENPIHDKYAKQTYLKACIDSFEKYELLIGYGVCREQARGVLPHSTYASLYITFNARSLMDFVILRSSPDAQWEICQYSDKFLNVGKELFPETFAAFEKNIGRDK